MMKHLFFVLFLVMGGVASGQNLSGKWLGELPQGNKNIKFKLEMDIIQTGKTLAGISTFVTVDNHKVVFSLTGKVDGRKISLEEYKAVSCDCEDGHYEFCLKKMTGVLRVDSANTLYLISGTWTSEKSYNGKQYLASVCSPGLFTIARPAFIRPLDGVYRKTTIPNATKITTYANLRERDVAFAKRIWREIDLREKANQYLASPKHRLIDVLMEGIDARDIIAYDPTPAKDNPNGDTFSTRLTPAQVHQRMADSSLVDIFDRKTGDKTGSKMVAGEFNADDIVKFRIKEDWLYDKQRDIFEPRILGIAPLIQIRTGLNTKSAVYQPAFWIYYPEARPVLATRAVANRSNDATGLSFDDVFMKRLFTSYIVKQSNDKEERVRDYTKGIDQLYESEGIKKGMADWEKAIWQY